MAEKEAAVDRYFTDYEEGTIDKALLEARTEKLGVELRALRRHRDELHLRIDDEPQHLTGVDLTALNAYIGEVIDHGTAAVRKSLCEAAIHELRIDLNASKATPRLPGEPRGGRRCPKRRKRPGRKPGRGAYPQLIWRS